MWISYDLYKMSEEFAANFNQNYCKNYESKTHWEKHRWVYIFVFLEALVILFYGLFTTYDVESNAFNAKTNGTNAEHTVINYYPIFQDIHVMMFIGFGFLYAYLRTYSWTSVGINYLLGAWSIQISILLYGFWTAVLTNSWDSKIMLNIKSLINADFAAAAVLISFGGVLGKFNMAQYMIMATIEIIFYSLNNMIGVYIFKAVDLGGSMFIHTFGAYFGLGVTYFASSLNAFNHKNNSSNYLSNLIGMIGTIFLWMYWPSFNCAISAGNARHRTIFNTIMSLTGSCLTVFIIGPIFRKGRFSMEAVLNATVAGGVVIGASADLILTPWASIIIGIGAGFLSLLGFEVIGPFLSRTIGLHDTAGIHNLHGMTGVLGGIISAIVAGTATQANYGDSLLLLFPMMDQRTNSVQAGYQLATLGLTIGIALVSGIITGLILNLKCLNPPNLLFSDRFLWDFEGISLDDGCENVKVSETPDRNELMDLKTEKNKMNID